MRNIICRGIEYELDFPKFGLKKDLRDQAVDALLLQRIADLRAELDVAWTPPEQDLVDAEVQPLLVRTANRAKAPESRYCAGPGAVGTGTERRTAVPGSASDCPTPAPQRGEFRR